MLRLSRLLILACVCLMTYGSAWAQVAVIWIVAPDTGGAHAEVQGILRTALDRADGVRWRTLTPEQLPGASPPPRLVVAVGAAALGAVVAWAQPLAVPPPVLAALLPRQAFTRELERSGRRLAASAVILDQPPARQVELIRAALPAARRVGLLLGPASRPSALDVSEAIAAAGMSVKADDVEQRGTVGALQSVLDDSDVLLALADPSVFNGDTLAGILAAGYRRQVPLVAFSPSYVKAGALAAVYATPAQIGRAAADAVRRWLAGGVLPPVAPPREFSIDVNPAVARSLGLAIDADALRARLGAERQP